MKILKYKCELLSDLILNEKSSSEGANNTLDFIPGSNFLGIVAKRYGEMTQSEAFQIFHSNKVRFGDAHPSVGAVRSLKAPSDFYYPKLASPENGCFLHHLYKREVVTSNNGFPAQLKQLREGFYAFDDDKGIKSQVVRNFSIKSAYDRTTRHSADEKMYGYESIGKGSEFYFSVEIDDENMAFDIDNALLGIQHIGRSRTAQFGLVNITRNDFKEVYSRSTSGDILIYADGRLIFLDDAGKPSMRPTTEQLGLIGGRIDWTKSQVRTFQYSPWNSKRECFDSDRCGFEKGSVFVVKDACLRNPVSLYVGSYRNEGFGKIIYNPFFLEAIDGSNGKAKTNLCTLPVQKQIIIANQNGNEALIQNLRKSRQQEEIQIATYSLVNDFIEKYGSRFLKDSFASQWGTIRSIASRCRTKQEVIEKLFSIPDGYIVHGVAKTKWEDYNRRKIFEQFVDSLNDEIIIPVLVNLAAEISKKCRKGELR